MTTENLIVVSANAPRFPHRETGSSERLQLVSDDCLQFYIRRDDQVRASSTRFYGGMWRWSLSRADGTVLASSAEYQSEEACRAALAIVRRHAGTSSLHNS